MEQETVTINTPSEDNVLYAQTKDELKRMKKQMQHQERLRKAQALRFQQPNANVKMEDLLVVGQDIRKLYNNHDILVKLLVKLGVFTEEQLREQEEYEQKRLEKFQELQQNTTMTADEKRAVAQEYNLPLKPLGLETTEERSDGERNIPEPTEQAQ